MDNDSFTSVILGAKQEVILGRRVDVRSEQGWGVGKLEWLEPSVWLNDPARFLIDQKLALPAGFEHNRDPIVRTKPPKPWLSSAWMVGGVLALMAIGATVFFFR